MIKKLKQFKGVSGTYTVTWDKSKGGAQANVSKRTMLIGTKYPHMILENLIHELSEIAHIESNNVYLSYHSDTEYQFSFSHAGHTTHTTLLTGMLEQFINTNVK